MTRGESRSNLVLMLTLTFGTGVIDAVGFIGLDQVFIANMTGNVVIMGMGVAGSQSLPVLGPVVALIGFLVGAALGGRITRRSRAGVWDRGTTWTLVGVGSGIAAAAVLAVTAEPTEVRAHAVTAILATAMGAQAAAARSLAVKDVTTVVVTSTLTGLAADSSAGVTRPAIVLRRIGVVVLLLAGATVGAVLVRWELAAGMALSAGLALAVAAAGAAIAHRASRSERRVADAGSVVPTTSGS